MKNLLFSLLLIIFSSFTYASCVFSEAYFSYEGGSEYLYTLFLNKDRTLTLHNEMWMPGKADEAQLVEYSGSWSCEGKHIVLSVSNQIYSAVYETVGANPIGLNPSAMSLKVAPSSFKLGGLVLLEFEV